MLIQQEPGTLLAEQSSELGEKIMQAHVSRATAEARLKVATAALASPQGVLGLPEVQSSPEILALRTQASVLAQRAAELSRSIGESYPKVVAVRAQMADVQSRLHQEADRALYDRLLARSKETNVESGLQQEVADDEGEVVEREVGGAPQGAYDGAVLFSGFPG
jgi:uncharacterized protein involved in exopolysaccharide biosynthesis